MLNECIPYKEAAYTTRFTVHLGYNVTGKRFVGPITTMQGNSPGLAADPLPAGDGGNMQCPAAPAAGGAVGGVSAWDGVSGGKLAVIGGYGTWLPVSSGAAVTAGNLLKVDTSGRVVPATTGTVVVGKAHSTVGAADLDVIVELYDTRDSDLSA